MAVNTWNRISYRAFQFVQVSYLTFFEMTIFLKSSLRISVPLPTVFRNKTSNRSSDFLSNPVLGRTFVKFEINSITWFVDTWFVASTSINRYNLSTIPLACHICWNFSNVITPSPHNTYATDSSCSAKSICFSKLKQKELILIKLRNLSRSSGDNSVG